MLDFIRKNWTFVSILLIAIAFIAGQVSSRGVQDYEAEKQHAIKVNQLEREIEYLITEKSILTRARVAIDQKRVKDSLQFASALKAKEIRIQVLLKHIANAPKFHSAADLDSAISTLYP